MGPQPEGQPGSKSWAADALHGLVAAEAETASPSDGAGLWPLRAPSHARAAHLLPAMVPHHWTCFPVTLSCHLQQIATHE